MSLKESQVKHWSKKGIEMVESYWNNPAHVKRCHWLASQIHSYDVSSIFEVGVMGGRNIDVLKTTLPAVTRFGGIDVNPVSIEFAKEHVPGADFAVSSVYDMDVEDKYDVVFSAGVFIHIPPDGIDEAISRCVQKASKYVMHMEGIGGDIVYKGPEELNPQKKVAARFQWRPNLVDRYKALGFNPEVIRAKYTNHRGDLSHLIIIDTEEYHGR